MPSEVWREWLRLPAGFLEQIIEYRAYERAKHLSDGADTPDARKGLPKSTMLDLVTVIEFEIAGEQRKAKAKP